MDAHVELYIQSNSSNESVSTGPLPVEHLGGDRYRLLSASMIEDLTFQDVFEADRIDDCTIQFRRIVEKSQWRTFTYMVSRELVESESLNQYLDSCDVRGFQWERLFGGMLFIHIPPGLDYDPTDEINALSK